MDSRDHVICSRLPKSIGKTNKSCKGDLPKSSGKLNGVSHVPLLKKNKKAESPHNDVFLQTVPLKGETVKELWRQLYF